MSYSYIIYGIQIDLDIPDDWTDWVAERYRILKPKGLYSDNIKAYDKYSKDKFNLLRKLNIRLEPYGNRKEYGYILGIHDSLFVINEDVPEIIEEKYLTIDKEWYKYIEKFLYDLNIKKEISCQWWIGVYNDANFSSV
jgi:hypothetical protein